jgi:hypothetical protein
MPAMTFLRAALLLGTSVCSLTGCYAGIRANEVSSSSDTAAQGIRYHLPAPYLIVERTAKGQVDAKVEYLADRSRVFYVAPYVIFATQKADIELNTDGTLKSFKLEQDSTPVSAAVVQGVKDVAIKKLDLEKADAEERAKRATSASERTDDKNAKTWVFALKGPEAVPMGSRELKLPPAADTGTGAPSGSIEGTFTATIGSAPAPRSSGDPKLTALPVGSTGNISVSHADHRFTKDDLDKGAVILEGVPQEAASADGKGNIIIKGEAIPAAGGKLKFRGEEVALKRGR